MITAEKLVELSKYFTTIHHVKGRLRVRVSPKIKEQSKDISISDIEELAQKIDGIKKIKINKVIGSITIEYDNNVFPKELWDDLVAGKNPQEIAQIINRLYKEGV